MKEKSLKSLVQTSMGGLPDFDEYDLAWAQSVELTVDTIEKTIDQ